MYTWRIESRGKVYHKLYVEYSQHHELKEPKSGLLNMLKHISALIWMRAKINFQDHGDGENKVLSVSSRYSNQSHFPSLVSFLSLV